MNMAETSFGRSRCREGGAENKCSGKHNFCLGEHFSVSSWLNLSQTVVTSDMKMISALTCALNLTAVSGHIPDAANSRFILDKTPS
jgi:hypothetical protein